jgi:CHAT domain-containing protein/tetratricopeptide (TPR) repeat protein
MTDGLHIIWLYRAEGDYTTALHLARARLAEIEHDPAAPPHDRRAARELVTTVEQILDLPPAAREALTRADASTPIIEDHCQHQRFAAVPPLAETQLEIRERWLGMDHPEVLVTLDYLSNAYLDVGRFEDAEVAARRTLEVRVASLDPADPGIAESRANLGMILRDRGLMIEAVDEFAASSRIWRAAVGDHPHAVLSLRNLGTCLAHAGRVAESEAPMLAALAMARRLHGQDHPLVASVLLHLAVASARIRDWSRSRKWALEALQILDEHPERLPNAYVRVLTTLGMSAGALGDAEGSHAWYDRAVAFVRENYADDSPHVGVCLLSRAAALTGLGDPSSLPWAREALERSIATYGEDRVSLEYAHYVLGRAHWCNGDLAAAETQLRRAVELGDRRANPPDRNDIDLADVLTGRGRLDEARAHLDAYMPRFELQRLMVSAGVIRALAAQEPYSRLGALALLTGDDSAAWAYAERAVGRLAADCLIVRRGAPAAREVRTRDRELRIQHRQLETQHAALLESADRNDPAVRERSREVKDALLEVMSRRAELGHALAGDRGLPAGEPFALDRVQASLVEDEAVVGWLGVRPRHQPAMAWGYVVRHRGPVTWARIDIDPRSSRSTLRDAIDEEAGLVLGPTTDEAICDAARAWWDERLRPLAPALDGVRTLVVVGAGAMSFAPLDVLLDPSRRAVVDAHACVYVPSGTIHAHLRETRRTARRATARPALLVADPEFGTGSAVSTEAETTRSMYGPGREIRARLPRLAASGEEVDLIASFFPRHRKLVGTGATERALIGLAERDELRQFGVVHIATHAVVDETSPERSMLVLSQHDLDDPLEAILAGKRAHRGVVTADEIARDWRLDADLVTLSACRTGVGPEVAGEGLVSFANAFLEAGARSVVVSLWRVDDRAAAQLMAGFYRRWLGATDDSTPMGKAEALRQARRSLRDHRDAAGRRPYAHPYYWAPFILFGDPR